MQSRGYHEQLADSMYICMFNNKPSITMKRFTIDTVIAPRILSNAPRDIPTLDNSLIADLYSKCAPPVQKHNGTQSWKVERI